MQTYFLLRADFVDGTKWDVIVPYPGEFENTADPVSTSITSRRRSITPKSPIIPQSPGILRVPKRVPNIRGIGLSSKNEAGVAHVFVDAVLGISHLGSLLIWRI